LGSRVKLVLWWAQGSHMKHLLSLILVLGCSSSAPSQYERGTLTGPPPAQQRPGVGLPTYDPHVAPRPEPQPKPARLLPQTPETRRTDGIWASASPEAKPAVAFDWNVPLPENDDEAAARIKRCAASMKVGTDRTLNAQDIKNFDKTNINWRTCWPHAAVRLCLERALGNEGLKAMTSPRPTAEAERLAHALDFTKTAYEEHCALGAPWSPGPRDRLDAAWGARQ
jgi:hypothetical protein